MTKSAVVVVVMMIMMMMVVVVVVVVWCGYWSESGDLSCTFALVFGKAIQQSTTDGVRGGGIVSEVREVVSG